MARVLIVHSSKMGGTKEIAERVGGVLGHNGFEVVIEPARHMATPHDFDAVVVGAALYSNRWPRPARRYVARFGGKLRAKPTWFFSSGPLDDSAGTGDIPPTRQVAKLMRRAGCARHRTFGGRLPEDAKGFPAAAMAKQRAGDWRDWNLIEGWAAEIADALALVA